MQPAASDLAFAPPADARRSARRATVGRLLVFLVVFAGFQGGYRLLAGTGVESFFVETAGSQPAAMLIRTVSPTIAVEARGARLTAAGGGINIRNGCEGTETLFLLIAAFASAPLGWRRRLIGIGLGIGFVLLINQIRIVGLFYAFRADRALFDLLHTLAAPLAMVVLVALYFHACLHLGQRRAPPA